MTQRIRRVLKGHSCVLANRHARQATGVEWPKGVTGGDRPVWRIALIAP